MAAALSLRPTPWRTCRAIANRTRLDMFGLLVRHPGLTVSAAAKELMQPLSLTSEYLRALEARGLLISRRVGGRVEYRVNSADGARPASSLAIRLRLAFQRNSQPVDTIFKIATAFTHPRRIEIFRVLNRGSQTLVELRLATRISRRAARRHLVKLEGRGFVVCRDGVYTVVGRLDKLRLEFARLATA
jgi:DNA-binding transcriptional ArsR family regulator